MGDVGTPRRHGSRAVAAGAAVVVLAAATVAGVLVVGWRGDGTSSLRVITPAAGATARNASTLPAPIALPTAHPRATRQARQHSSNGSARTRSTHTAPAATPPTAAAPTTAAAPPAGLVVHVTLSTDTVHIGEPLLVTYSWSDGDGDLVDTNNVGTMAEKVVRNVACTGSSSSARPSSGHGTWTYVPVPSFVGPLAPTAKVFVGFNVRTGGCAPVEDKTAGAWVTILPALQPTSPGAPVVGQ